MLIKTVLCVTLLIFTSGIGYGFAVKYRKRKLFFAQLYDFNEKFLLELSYSKRPLIEFIKSFAYKSDFADLLQEFLLKIEEDDFFNDYFSAVTFLKPDEEREISLFFKDLGRGDSETQKKTFMNHLQINLKKKEKTNEEYKKYGELYVKLGVLAGLSIIIIII